MARVWSVLASVLLAQRGHLFPWVPVFFGLGICVFFALLFEPSLWALGACALAGFAGLVFYGRSASAFGPLICALAMVSLGGAAAGVRAHLVAGPVLDWRYYGPITGRVVGIDRSASDAVRVTLDQVWLTRVDHRKTPKRVRLSLHGSVKGVAPAPGMVVMTTGHLGPPGGAVEPGGFDFRRHAWFLSLGAVGYTRVPLVLWEETGKGQTLFRLRMALSARIQTAMPGATGAFATAIITGDRSAIPQDVMQALRDTNLAHLLAISGLHMGLVSGFVFGVLRLALLLSPWGLVWPVKKIAALGALGVAAGYLVLSGGNVATERAFIMVAVMLLAILCNRRAISLRAVALAALLVLALRPEAILGPGFQMSFAATTALVAVFGALRDSAVDVPKHPFLRGAFSVLVSSAVAGAATAPFAMAHFNQIAQFGLLANLATVPLMGMLVIPAAVLAVCLMPFGLEIIGLHVMGWGLDWILSVARTIGAWPGAVRPVMTPAHAVLPLLTGGALLICLWQGRARWFGVGPVILAVWFWMVSERPDILVAEGGALVGVMTPEGRALSREKGAGFVARVWLENDGEGGAQASAASLWDTHLDSNIHHVHGKRAAAQFTTCPQGALVIASTPLLALPAARQCTVFGPDDLSQTGSLAIARTSEGRYHVTKARDLAGARLWNDRSVREAQ